jgi:hypothetical protein
MASKKLGPDDGLNDRQRRFVYEYLLDLSAVAAYRRAGYKAKTYAAMRAGASEILANPNVQDAIRRAEHQQIEKAKIRNWELLREARIIATSDIERLVMDEEGRLSDPDDPLGTRVVASKETEFEYVSEPEELPPRQEPEEQRGENQPEEETEKEKPEVPAQTEPVRKFKRRLKKGRIRLWDKMAALKLLFQQAGLIDNRDALEKFLDALPPGFLDAVLQHHANEVGR